MNQSKFKSDLTSAGPPIISKSEQFFEWRPKFISYLHQIVPELDPWLPRDGTFVYPDPNQPPYPADPGVNVPTNALFDNNSTAAEREFAKQNLDLYKYQRQEFLHYRSAKIKCTQLMLSAIEGDVKQRLMNNQDFVNCALMYQFQTVWSRIVEATKFVGMPLREEQDKVYAQLKNMRQREDEPLDHFNTKFDYILRYLRELGNDISNIKKCDIYLKALNSRFRGLKESFVIHERHSDPNFNFEDMKFEARKVDCAYEDIYGNVPVTRTYLSAAINLADDDDGVEIEVDTFASNVSPKSSGVPDWLTKVSLTGDEYSALSNDQKRARGIYKAGEKHGGKNINKRKSKCNYCNQVGHFVKECPAIKSMESSKKDN